MGPHPFRNNAPLLNLNLNYEKLRLKNYKLCAKVYFFENIFNFFLFLTKFFLYKDLNSLNRLQFIIKYVIFLFVENLSK